MEEPAVKQRVRYADVFGDPWTKRFNEIHDGQRITIAGRIYRVKQKNEEPAWLHIKAVCKPREEMMIHKGDPRLLEESST